jgi:hypothetical protein
MTQTIPERRAMRRFDMRLPAAVKLAREGGEEMVTETHNVSAAGVFFSLERPLQPGDNIEITLTFPPHVTLTEKVRVRFSARVIRVEQQQIAGTPVGVAAAIEGYEFLRQQGLEPAQESGTPSWSQQ